MIMGEDATDAEKELFKVELYEYLKHHKILRYNLEKSYTLILVQCTDITCMQLKEMLDWEAFMMQSNY